jgi:hypothetical protein
MSDAKDPILAAREFVFELLRRLPFAVGLFETLELVRFLTKFF